MVTTSLCRYELDDGVQLSAQEAQAQVDLRYRSPPPPLWTPPLAHSLDKGASFNGTCSSALPRFSPTVATHSPSNYICGLRHKIVSAGPHRVRQAAHSARSDQTRCVAKTMSGRAHLDGDGRGATSWDFLCLCPPVFLGLPS